MMMEDVTWEWAAIGAALGLTMHWLFLDLRTGLRFCWACMVIGRMMVIYRLAEMSGGVTSGTHRKCARILTNMFLTFGGIWAKIGQFAALRSDLIPPEYAEEFSRCQDQLPHRPFKQVRKTIELELGCDLYEVFHSVDEEAISCATISQVHRGKMFNSNGSLVDVAIKIQHPDVETAIAKDLRLVKFFYDLIMRYSPERNHSLKVCALYLMAVSSELDFRAEARNIKRIETNLSECRRLRPNFLVPFARPATEADLDRMVPGTEILLRYDPENPNSLFQPGYIVQRTKNSLDFQVQFHGGAFDLVRNLKDIKLNGDNLFINVTVPQVFDRLTTKRLLVMSFEDGIPAKAIDHTKFPKEELEEQVTMIARAFSQQVLLDEFVHCDPHPANILYRPGKAPVILDFGLCMELDPRIVRGWCKVVYGATQLILNTMYEGFIDLGFKPVPGDPRPPAQQMVDLCRTLMPLATSSNVNDTFKYTDIDRRTLLKKMYEHKLVHYDFLCILRITNYVGNLCSKFDLRAITSIYPEIAEKSLHYHNWLVNENNKSK